MNKKDKIKIRFSTVVCIIIIAILIYIVAIITYRNIQEQKIIDQINENLENKSKILDEQIETLQNIISNKNSNSVQEETTQTSIESENTQSTTLSEDRKIELYNNIFDNNRIISGSINITFQIFN